mmetsp:Transcript_15960/g.62127  ORF Transcript_15960/g.62127 Transcript_15960/m.62127 type:complete len:242 (-) Transcript_15960:1157-1882(-)
MGRRGHARHHRPGPRATCDGFAPAGRHPGGLLARAPARGSGSVHGADVGGPRHVGLLRPRTHAIHVHRTVGHGRVRGRRVLWQQPQQRARQDGGFSSHDEHDEHQRGHRHVAPRRLHVWGLEHRERGHSRDHPPPRRRRRGSPRQPRRQRRQRQGVDAAARVRVCHGAGGVRRAPLAPTGRDPSTSVERFLRRRRAADGDRRGGRRRPLRARREHQPVGVVHRKRGHGGRHPRRGFVHAAG